MKLSVYIMYTALNDREISCDEASIYFYFPRANCFSCGAQQRGVLRGMLTDKIRLGRPVLLLLAA